LPSAKFLPKITAAKILKPKRSIFDFYRTGKLQRPHDIPINVFIREVQFYEIQNEIIPEEYLKLPQSKIKVGFPRAPTKIFKI